MKLYFKQRFFSWFDSYDIYHEDGSVAYTVEGKLSWGHCLHILNPQGEHIATVQQRVLTFLPRFELYVGDRCVGEIRKEVYSFPAVVFPGLLRLDRGRQFYGVGLHHPGRAPDGGFYQQGAV